MARNVLTFICMYFFFFFGIRNETLLVVSHISHLFDLSHKIRIIFCKETIFLVPKNFWFLFVVQDLLIIAV